MKVLVLSDSHSSLRFMRASIQKIMPDAVVHLGDYFDDGQAMAEEFAPIPFLLVPGNCDRYRCVDFQQDVRILTVGGVKLFMTHGHRYGVKSGTERLLTAARAAGAGAVLYGHTHMPDCRREPDGLWVLNPGSCGYFGGTAGMMEVENGCIRDARILTQKDLEEIK